MTPWTIYVIDSTSRKVLQTWTDGAQSIPHVGDVVVVDGEERSVVKVAWRPERTDVDVEVEEVGDPSKLLLDHAFGSGPSGGGPFTHTFKATNPCPTFSASFGGTCDFLPDGSYTWTGTVAVQDGLMLMEGEATPAETMPGWTKTSTGWYREFEDGRRVEVERCADGWSWYAKLGDRWNIDWARAHPEVAARNAMDKLGELREARVKMTAEKEKTTAFDSDGWVLVGGRWERDWPDGAGAGVGEMEKFPGFWRWWVMLYTGETDCGSGLRSADEAKRSSERAIDRLRAARDVKPDLADPEYTYPGDPTMRDDADPDRCAEVFSTCQGDVRCMFRAGHEGQHCAAGIAGGVVDRWTWGGVQTKDRVLWVQDHDGTWHTCMDGDGLTTKCGKTIAGAPNVFRISDRFAPADFWRHRCDKCAGWAIR
jgi:hypothetical protein